MCHSAVTYAYIYAHDSIVGVLTAHVIWLSFEIARFCAVLFLAFNDLVIMHIEMIIPVITSVNQFQSVWWKHIIYGASGLPGCVSVNLWKFWSSCISGNIWHKKSPLHDGMHILLHGFPCKVIYKQWYVRSTSTFSASLMPTTAEWLKALNWFILSFAVIFDVWDFLG